MKYLPRLMRLQGGLFIVTHGPTGSVAPLAGMGDLMWRRRSSVLSVIGPRRRPAPHPSGSPTATLYPTLDMYTGTTVAGLTEAELVSRGDAHRPRRRPGGDLDRRLDPGRAHGASGRPRVDYDAIAWLS